MNQYFNLGAVKPLYYFFGVSAFLGVIFASVTKNEQSHFIFHLILWLLQAMGPILLLVYTHVALHSFRTFDRLHPLLKLAISGFLGAVFFSPFALSLDFLWNNDEIPSDLTSLLLMWLDELSGVLVPIVATWIAINAPWVLGYTLTAQSHQNDEKNQIPSAADMAVDSGEIDEQCLEYLSKPHIYNYLKQDELGDIIFMKAELHYLLVMGTKQKQLILYNLKDAIDDLPANMGIKAHRSFWVNRAHITKVVKLGRQAKVVMSNASEIPISRANVTLLREFL